MTTATYSINVTDTDHPTPWHSTPGIVSAAPGNQDSGRCRWTVVTTDPAALEAALDADDAVISYDDVTERAPARCPHCETEREHRACDDCGAEAAVIDCGHHAQPAAIAAGHRGLTQCARCYAIEDHAARMLDRLGRDAPEVVDALAAVGGATPGMVAVDIGRLVDDPNERAALLAECLDGADTEAAWRAYVDAVAAAAEAVA